MRALLQADGTATACAALQQHSSDVRTTHLAALHILLAVSIASDKMIRAFHMFQEVTYLDVTSNTNAEG